MTEYIEFTAKHTEEALKKACHHFGLPLNRLEWEIIDTGSSGLFGFIGAKKARVKVRPVAESIVKEIAALASVVSEQEVPHLINLPNSSDKKNESLREIREPSLSSLPLRSSSPSIEPQPAAIVDLKENKIDEALKIKNEIYLDNKKEDEKKTGITESRAVEENLGQETEIIYARQVLSQLIAPLDPQAYVNAKNKPSGIELEIISRETGVLIGRRGQHLEALQYLVTRIVNCRKNKLIRIVIDTDNYRERRRKALEEIALKMADKAKTTGKDITIGPLSTPERRLIYIALKNYPGIMTTSRGRGDLKKIIITAY